MEKRSFKYINEKEIIKFWTDVYAATISNGKTSIQANEQADKALTDFSKFTQSIKFQID